MKISEFIENRLRMGIYTFSIDDLTQKYKLSKKAMEMGLYRLKKKQMIASVFKGFYTIVPPQYRNMGGLPPTMYIHDLMEYLGLRYYVSHLSAAAMHGAAHQQPQVFFVVHNKRNLRTASQGIMPIIFIKKSNWSQQLIEKKNTETGYLNVSSPLLTVMDLVNDIKKVGGIDRVATVINELAEYISIDQIELDFHQANLQRLGYLLDSIGHTSLGSQLWENLFKDQKPSKRYPLIPTKNLESWSCTNRWNIIENTEIEIDV